MINVGDVAPDFELTGVADGEKSRYTLSEATDRGKYIILVFYPADFSPVCTAEMCAIRDSEFFSFTENVEVWGVNGDSVYSHQAFARQFGLTFPLLADTDRAISQKYNSRYDEWEGQLSMTKRAVYLIDPNRRVRYVWTNDDAYVEPQLWPIKEALDEAIAQGLETEASPEDIAEPDTELKVEPLE